jgi:FkbM family methyltransferase
MTIERLMGTALSLVPWPVRRHVKQFPGVGRLQRHLLSVLLDGREFTHGVDAGPAKGIRFRIRLPEDKGIWTGTYELDFAKRLAASVRQGAVAYDIGSWHGFFAGVMAAQGAREVIVFEPLPANADRIRVLIALNPDHSIRLHPVAVGDRDTVMDLVVMPQTSMAKLAASGFQPAATSLQRIRTRVRSIDSILQAGEAPPPHLMKIDVEGAELLALEGARETLRSHRPEIFAEIHSAALLEQCTRFLAEAGYRIELLDAGPAAARATGIHQVRASAGTAA